MAGYLPLHSRSWGSRPAPCTAACQAGASSPGQHTHAAWRQCCTHQPAGPGTAQSPHSRCLPGGSASSLTTHPADTAAQLCMNSMHGRCTWTMCISNVHEQCACTMWSIVIQLKACFQTLLSSRAPQHRFTGHRAHNTYEQDPDSRSVESSRTCGKSSQQSEVESYKQNIC